MLMVLIGGMIYGAGVFTGAWLWHKRGNGDSPLPDFRPSVEVSHPSENDAGVEHRRMSY